MSIPPHSPDTPGVDTATGGLIGRRPVRWGFVGAGAIAATFARAVADSTGSELVAVGAREAAHAESFAAEHGVSRWYAGYDGVLADPEVDVVYVATTHPHHHGPALAAVRAGKAVLVEKPFALNAELARQVFHEARDRGVFAMEAMWLRTQPLLREVAHLVGEGEIGDLVTVSAEFAVAVDYDAGHRLYDLDNGGGALLDLGVYAAWFCWMFLGEPESVQVMGSLAPTGADALVAMQWGYDTGALGSLVCTSQGAGPNRATIIGRRGWVEIEPPFWRSPERAVIHRPGEPERVLTVPSRGYVHQVEEVERCLRAGLLESPLVPTEDSLAILEILDAARSELGVRYPQE